MRKESEREAARLYDEMVRKRIAQQDAEAVSEVYDKLVNVYGPKDQKAKLSKRLTYDDPDIVE
jgi:lipopolysaccharide biosynthesis regulator YciM